MATSEFQAWADAIQARTHAYGFPCAVLTYLDEESYTWVPLPRDGMTGEEWQTEHEGSHSASGWFVAFHAAAVEVDDLRPATVRPSPLLEARLTAFHGR